MIFYLPVTADPHNTRTDTIVSRVLMHCPCNTHPTPVFPLVVWLVLAAWGHANRKMHGIASLRGAGSADMGTLPLAHRFHKCLLCCLIQVGEGRFGAPFQQ